MRKLWKASRLYNVPLTHPYLKDLNDYDLILMEWLHLFEDPKQVELYTNKVIDDSFEDYVNEIENMNNSQQSVVNNNDEWVEVNGE